MKTYRNKKGAPMTYDENAKVTVFDAKTHEVVAFSADETLEFLLENNIWDGYHHPFDVLSIKKWIQTLKMIDNMSSLPIKLRKDNDVEFRSDFEIAQDIRKLIDYKKENKNGYS